MTQPYEVQPLNGVFDAQVQVPGSKSITNRALVLAALTAKGYACALHGALRSEDTEVMIEALRALGFRVLTDWPESRIYVSSGEDEPLIPARSADLFVGNSGTTMRFLTAMVSLGHGRYRLDHPLVGPLDLHYEAVDVAGTGNWKLIAYSAQPNTLSADALRLIGSWTSS